jgi:hypothetical protein
VRGEGGKGGEMTQTLYAHMYKIKIKKKRFSKMSNSKMNTNKTTYKNVLDVAKAVCRGKFIPASCILKKTSNKEPNIVLKSYRKSTLNPKPAGRK